MLRHSPTALRPQALVGVVKRHFREGSVASFPDVLLVEIQLLLSFDLEFQIATPLHLVCFEELIEVFRLPLLLPPMQLGVVVIGELLDALGQPVGIEA